MASTLAHKDKIEDTLKLEEEALDLEFKWLLDTELSKKLESLHKYFKACDEKFSVVLNPTSGSSGHKLLLLHPQQLVTGCDGGHLIVACRGEPPVCVASVKGDKISRADINIRFPGKSAKPLRTSIKEHAAWKLKQVQDSANHFQIAYQKLLVIMNSREKLKETTGLCQAFTELTNSLRESEQVLVVPQLPSVAEIYSAELRSHFKPELPEDYIVHFHVNSYKLVLKIFNVSQISKPSTTSNVTYSYQVGSMFEYGSNHYQVTNQLQVHCPVPWLSHVIILLQQTQEIAQDFLNKVKVFTPQ